MDINKEKLATDQKNLKDENLVAVDKPRVTSLAPNLQASLKKNVGGGGGADSSHGQVFHLTIAMLMLFSLKDMSQADLGLQYHIWLEKAGYGKFDDIVVRYKKSGGKWIEICVQCKHGEEKVSENEEIYINSVTADDLFSHRNKQFSILEYMNSFREVESENKDCEKYYILLTNRAYNDNNDIKYKFLRCKEIVDFHEIIPHDLLINHGFRLEYNDEIVHFCSEASLKFNVKLDECVIANFCKKFCYIHDNRDLESVLHSKLTSHCKSNEEITKNLKARLYFLVSQMYQHKMDPNQQHLLNEFNGRNVSYKIYPAYSQFIGRVKEIQRIKEALELEQKRNVFDLLVTGMAGMGKTQIVRKYIEEFNRNYKHLIWINAENTDSLEGSFFDLAKSCNLINDNFQHDILAVTTLIYSYFRENTLFVFDNTCENLLTKNDKNEYHYLPNDVQFKKNRFIIISQGRKWTTSYTVTLKEFSENDALLYLDSSIECSKEEKQELALTFQYWPLALCLAASYIKLESEQSLGRKTCSEVIKTLQIDNDKLQTHAPQKHEMEPYTKSLQSLWQRIRNKLNSEGSLSLKIIEMISFSDPDDFSIDLLNFDEYSSDEVKSGVLFLVNSSIVTVSDFKISIHRTLQSVIRNSVFLDTNLYGHIISLGIKSFSKYLKSIDEIENKKRLGNNHMVTFLYHLTESKIDIEKYIEMANMLLSKLISSEDLRIHCMSDGIFDKMVIATEQILGRDNIETHIALANKAAMLEKIGKYNESLDMYNVMIEYCKEKLGESHFFTLYNMDKKGFVLIRKGLYEQALSIYGQILKLPSLDFFLNDKDQCVMLDNDVVLNGIEKSEQPSNNVNKVIKTSSEHLGRYHHDTLTCMHNKATALFFMGKYEEALSIFNQIIETRSERLGIYHPDTLSSMNIKAIILGKMGKFEDALDIDNQLIKARSERLGIHHLDTLKSMNNKSNILKYMGMYKEALSILNPLLESKSEQLGTHNPSTLISMNNKAEVLTYMGKYEEALSILNPLIKARSDHLGLHHIDTLRSMNDKAKVLQRVGKYDEALEIQKKVFEEREKRLGLNNPDTLITMNNIADVLNEVGKYEESLNICNKVIELRNENTFNIYHPPTLKSLHLKSDVLNNIGKYEEALDICNQVMEPRKKVLGNNHPDTLKTVFLKSKILKNKESFAKLFKSFRILFGLKLDQFEKHHHDIFTSLVKKAGSLIKLGKYIDAVSSVFDVFQKIVVHCYKNSHWSYFSLLSAICILGLSILIYHLFF